MNIFGNPSGRDVHGNSANGDVVGNPAGTDAKGNAPNDAWGHYTSDASHGGGFLAAVDFLGNLFGV
ncbi:MAG TPA: hypothetical protein DDY78_22120 [Planctomycetales bacterium]|jgi:hypothetical protein|nr:hypothetical protein [Planctomycetales bacterium]